MFDESESRQIFSKKYYHSENGTAKMCEQGTLNVLKFLQTHSIEFGVQLTKKE